MTEVGRFFDGVSYTEADQADTQTRFRREGVLAEVSGLLAVGAPTGLFVSVAAGEAFVQGFHYKNTASKNLAIAANTSGSTRIDRVVLRLLRTTNSILSVVIQGTPGGGLPALTQVVGGDWDYPLATVTVPTGTTTNITASMIADVRTYSYQLSSADAFGEIVLNPATGVRKELAIDTTTKLPYWAEVAASGRNFLHNAMLRINQRAAVGTTANAAVLADRWRNINLGTAGYVGGLTGSNPPSPTQAGTRPTKSLYELSGGVTITAAMLAGVFQYMEGYDFENIYMQNIVISWWSYATRITTMAVAVSNGVDRSYVHPYTHNTAAALQYNWFTMPFTPTGGTWNFDTGQGCLIAFMTAAGSTYQTATTDAWINGIFYAGTTISNNLTTNAVDYAAVSLPKVELGIVPTRFTSPDITQDMNDCFRQYWQPITGSSRGVPGVAEGSTNVHLHNFKLPVPMRLTPTFTNSITAYGTTGPGSSSTMSPFVMRTGAFIGTATFSSASSWDSNQEECWIRTISTGASGVLAGDLLETYFGTGCNIAFGAEL